MGNLSKDISPTGELLTPNLGENIFEIITVPYPKFMTIQYEITFWTQYMVQMNQLIESMMSQFSGQGHDFSMITENGYELVAYLKSPLNTEDNFANYSSDERIIRYTFTMVVPTFILAPQDPGLPSPFRRYYSAPQFEFGVKQVSTAIYRENPDIPADNDLKKFILNDVEVLNAKGEQSLERGQDSSRFLVEVQDPFSDDKKNKVLMRVLTTNQRAGETVLSARIIKDLDTISD